MITAQRENVKVHKENMELKGTIHRMEHRVAEERESNRLQYETLEGRIRDLAHGLEKQLQLAGQSRGTAILNASFTMGDTNRISKVLKERSNYTSAGEVTPEREGRGGRPKLCVASSKGSTCGACRPGGHDTGSENKATQASLQADSTNDSK